MAPPSTVEIETFSGLRSLISTRQAHCLVTLFLQPPLPLYSLQISVTVKTSLFLFTMLKVPKTRGLS